MVRYQDLWKTNSDPFDRIRCAGAGKHLNPSGQWLPRTKVAYPGLGNTFKGDSCVALGRMSRTVFAATKDKPNVTLVNIDELSLYTTPQPKSSFVKTEDSLLEQGVAAIRNTVKPYATWCQGTYGKVKPKVEHMIQVGSDGYAYLKNPPSEFYPRAGIIGFTGFLGLYLARGSKVKRLIYPSGLMAISTSLYYPQPAATIVKSTGDFVYDLALQGYVAVENLVKPASQLAGEKTVTEEKPEGLSPEARP